MFVSLSPTFVFSFPSVDQDRWLPLAQKCLSVKREFFLPPVTKCFSQGDQVGVFSLSIHPPPKKKKLLVADDSPFVSLVLL